MTSRTTDARDVPADRSQERPAAGMPARGRKLPWVGLVVGLLGLVTAVLLPLAPVHMSVPEVTWPQQPDRPASTMLELTSQRPLTLDVRFSCATVRAAGATADGVLLATIRPDAVSAGTTGLLATVRGGVLRVESAGHVLLDRPVAAAGECAYRLRADGDGVVLTRDGAVVGRAPNTAIPQVDVLATSLRTLSPGAGLAVRLQVDDQFATGPTAVKLVLVVLSLLAAAGSILWLRRTAPGRAPERAAPDRGGYFRARRAVDVGVVAVLLLWTLVAPMSPDDGYYAAMARNSTVEGFVGNYYQLLDQSFTPFTWFYRLLGWWQQLAGDAPAVLKVPALVAGLLTYGMAARVVAVVPWSRARTRTVAHLGVALGFAVWWLPYDMVVRPETAVALFGSAVLLAVVTAIRRQSLAWWAGAVLLAGVGFVCHPTGFVVLAPLIAGLPSLVRLLRRGGPWTAAARLVCVLAPAAVASVAAFGDGTLRDFVRGQQIFLTVQAQQTWLDEYQRYWMLLGPGFMGTYAKRLPVLVTIVALFAWLVLAAVLRGLGRPLPRLFQLVAVSTMLGFLLLWPTPSKWSMHFGSIAGVGAVFLALVLVSAPRALRELRAQRLLRWPVASAVGAAVVLAIALSFAGQNAWPGPWLVGVPYPGVPPRLFGLTLSSPALWAVLVVLAGAVLWWRNRQARAADEGPRSLLLATVLVLVGALTLCSAYLVGGFTLGAVRTLGSWSPEGDGLRDPLARSCDAARAVQVLDDGHGPLLPLVAGQPSPQAANGPVVPVFREGSGWYPADPPASTAGPVWGSLQPPALENAVGTTTTSWYGLPRVDPRHLRVAVTAAGRLTDGNHLVAEYGRVTGGTVTVLGRQALDDGLDLSYWRTLLLDPAAAHASGADAVRLVATDGSTGVGGWLAFSQPALRTFVPVQQYLRGVSPVVVSWQASYLFPCQRLPTISDGITEPSSAGVLYGATFFREFRDGSMLVSRGGLFAPVFREASVTILPAVLPEAPGVHDVHVYRFEEPYPAGRYVLTPHRVRVSGIAAPPGWGDRPAR